MDIELWMLTTALPAVMLATWMICRWFYIRRIREAQRRIMRLDSSCQSMAKLQMQARKQVAELQSIVDEYRRRLTTAELSRRAPLAPIAASRDPLLESIDEGDSTPRAPVTWDDTRPM